MKFLISFLLSFSALFGFAQTTPFAFTQLSSTTWIYNYGAGAEFWNGRTWSGSGGGNGVPNPVGNTNQLLSKNAYNRFNWKDFQNASASIFNWAAFDFEINRAIDNKMMFSFRVMPLCIGCGTGQIPDFVHTLMQGEAQPDWFYAAQSYWIPNWNSNSYHFYYSNMLRKLAEHIQTGSHSGVAYKNVIYQVDIGTFGDYGEGHQSPWDGSQPSYINPTSANLKRMIDSTKAIFPNNQLMVLVGWLDYDGTSHMPNDVVYYALTSRNNRGAFGLRRDNVGDAGLDRFLKNNPNSFGGINFKDSISLKWKTAPWNGEPLLCCAGELTHTCPTPYCDVPVEVNTYHFATIGNGNIMDPVIATTRTYFNQGFAASGNRITLQSGNMTTTLTQSSGFNIKLDVQNLGLTPTYEDWNWTYELRSGVTVVWTGTSSFNPKLFLPQGSTTLVSDNFVLTGVSVGSYDLYLKIKDPLGYKDPLALAITGRLGDGAYLLRSGISVVTSGGSNIFPNPVISPSTGNITLPTNSISLDGSGSNDPDGTIVSYFWDQVSGPSSATITGNTSVSALFSNLIQGTYIFRLKVTDNNGASSSLTVNVIVNPAITPPPTVGGVTVFTTQTPGGGTSNDGQGITIGMKFRSTLAGSVQGVRYFKTSGNVGTHIALLYQSNGALLGQITFGTESSSGWQNVAFASPIPILPNVTYIVAYYSSAGNYTYTTSGFSGAIVNGPLTGLATGTDGANGVYNYGTSPVFPTLNALTPANYWVDVFFKANVTCATGGCLPGRRKPSKVKNGL